MVMKIGIEGQRLFREKKHGMDMVALELIRNLQKIDTENQYYIFIKPDVDDGCLDETANFKIIRLDGGSYPQWEQKALPKAASKYECDILHCTSNTAPLSGDIPLVVHLHDIIYMEKSYLQIIKGSGTPYQKFGNVYRRFIVPRMIKRAKKLITVSEFEKKRIDDFFNLPAGKLVAIHNGVSEHFRPIDDKEYLEEIRKKYNLPGKYFFFLGNTDPKKNTAGVLEAMRDFYKTNNDGYKLVMPDYDEDELMKLLTRLGAVEMRKDIFLTGYIVNTDLPAIVNMSTVFLYPSLRESFGIPVLEGMRCGVPVITSNTSSMPEVAGDAAYIIDPYQPAQITKAIHEVLADDNLRKTLMEKGLKRASLFSWENMARKVLDLYKTVYEETKNKKL
jgi:glycosyltransferase involved in cell wall biosynthesis